MKESSSRNHLVELVLARWHIVRLLVRSGGPLVPLLLVVNLVLGALPVVFVLMTSVVLGRVPAAVAGGPGSAAWTELATVFAAAAAAFVAQQIIAPIQNSLGEFVARRIDGRVFRDLMATSLRSPGVAPLEDQDVLDDLATAARDLEFGPLSPGQAGAGLLALVARYTQLAGYAVVVGVVFSWLAAAGLVVVVMLFRYGQRGGLRKYAEVRIALARDERKSDYLRRLAIEPAAGKEIRVFGLVNWLRDEVREAFLTVIRPLWTKRRKVYLWPFVFFTGCALAVIGTTFAVIGATAPEALTLTGFVVVMQVVLSGLRLGEFYPEADPQTAIGMIGYDAVRRYRSRMDSYLEENPAALLPGRPGAKPGPVPTPSSVIHFDNVVFRYPGRERPVFDGLDLTIPVGRCTALVGVNGAGKTTLVKLLARLYEPESGAVRVDGVDIRSYQVDEWRAKLAVIFQDFLRYESSVADNIGFGSRDFLDDRAGIRAAADAVGLGEFLEALPRGLDTPLARQLTGGAELSGGQWQRVALARALFALRHGSPVIVLDEPTASLDVRAEAGFFDEFADLTHGATTLLISHRFSTVRHADRIVVLEHGKVTEQGSHEELLAANGRYAHLFRLQADQFVDTADIEEVPA
ncbi:ABC transporter ATP-binding protein [Amycolatopsis mediterranei]|uniref:ABC transporter ATP-binding protein n=1 Tax=Amycolatopsis mediterranei TaxID=33910 RepID=UPI0034460634